MRRLLTTAAAVAFVFAFAGPSVAEAQIGAYNGGQWLYGNPQQQQFLAAVGAVVSGDDQRSAINSIVNDGYAHGATDRQIDDRIMAVLSPDQRNRLTAQLGWSGTGSFRSNGNGGIVRSVSRGSITLQSGRTAFLRDSTSFVPNRDAIVPGARIAIQGTPISDGNVNADRVEVIGNAGAGALAGVVSNVSRGAISLQNGRTAFLNDATSFEPNRDAIRPGVAISVRGNAIADGNVNAESVSVVSFTGDFGNVNGGWYQSYQNGRYLAVIASVSKGAITFRNGHTAFLRDGTTIRPTGTTLQPGMRVAVSGDVIRDGNLNANAVDVVNSGVFNVFDRNRF